MQLETRWTTELNDYVFNAPVLTDDAILAGCDDGYAYLFDQSDGTICRRFQLSDWVRGDSGPTVVGDEAYVPTHDPGGPRSDERGRVYRVDLTTGTTEPIIDETREYNAMPGLDATTETVCVSVGEVLTAYEPRPFDERWTFETQRPGEEPAYLTPPVIDGERVYVGGRDATGSLYALEVASVLEPDIRWEADLHGDPTNLTTAGNLVVVATRDGTVEALDAEDGSRRWQAETEPEPDAPRFANGRVYVVAGGTVYALNADDGSRAWTFEADGGLRGPVGVSESIVCVSAFSGGAAEPTDAVYAIDTATGRQTARVRTGEENLSPPLVDGTDMYVGGGSAFVAYEVVNPPRPVEDAEPSSTVRHTESETEDEDRRASEEDRRDRKMETDTETAEEMVERTVEIRKDQATWLDEAYFDLSAFVRDKIDEQME